MRPPTAEQWRDVQTSLTAVVEGFPNSFGRNKPIRRLLDDLPFLIAYADGKSMASIGQAFGCSQQWVSQVLRRNGYVRGMWLSIPAPTGRPGLWFDRSDPPRP